MRKARACCVQEPWLMWEGGLPPEPLSTRREGSAGFTLILVLRSEHTAVDISWQVL